MNPTGQQSRPHDAVVGRAEVRIIVPVTRGDRTAKIQAGFAALHLRKGAPGEGQEKNSEDK